MAGLKRERGISDGKEENVFREYRAAERLIAREWKIGRKNIWHFRSC